MQLECSVLFILRKKIVNNQNVTERRNTALCSGHLLLLPSSFSLYFCYQRHSDFSLGKRQDQYIGIFSEDELFLNAHQENEQKDMSLGFMNMFREEKDSRLEEASSCPTSP